MAAVHHALAAKVGVAAVAVFLAMTAPVSADMAGSCVDFTGHQVLSAPGGVLKLRDGREVRARIIDVGGCTTRPDWVTGKAHPDASSNYTTMSRGTTKTSDAASQCVTGVPNKAGAAQYTSFQAIVIDTNGFQFTPSFVLEDIDAQDNAAHPSEGWRETMSSLGSAGGHLVYPQMSTRDGALVGMRQFGMPAESLKAVGLPVVSGLTIEGAAFLAEVPKNCPFLKDTTSECKAFVKYTAPVDKLVIIYAVTQRSMSDPKSVAFFSELTLSCGCQCTVDYPPPGATKVVAASPGKCDLVKDTAPHHKCDFLGGHWCDTVPSFRYVFTGEDKFCKLQPSVVQRPLSTYKPSRSFGHEEPTKTESQLVTSESAPSKTESEATKTESAPSKTESEATKTESAPSKTESEATKTESAPSKTESEATSTESASKTESQQTKTESEATSPESASKTESQQTKTETVTRAELA